MSLLALVCVFILVTTNAQDIAQERLGQGLVIVQVVVLPFVREDALEVVPGLASLLAVALVLIIVLLFVAGAVLVVQLIVAGALEVVEPDVRLVVLGNVKILVLLVAPMLVKATVVLAVAVNAGKLVRLVAGELLSNI